MRNLLAPALAVFCLLAPAACAPMRNSAACNREYLEKTLGYPPERVDEELSSDQCSSFGPSFWRAIGQGFAEGLAGAGGTMAGNAIYGSHSNSGAGGVSQTDAYGRFNYGSVYPNRQ